MALQDDIDRLKRVSFLSVLDEEALRHIAFNCEHHSADDGSTVFFEGEAANGACVLLEGRVSLESIVSGERRERAVLKSGDIADPYALISDVRHSNTGRAVGPVRYILLDRPTFRKVLENYPDMAERVRDYLANDIENTVTSLSGVASRLDFLDR